MTNPNDPPPSPAELRRLALLVLQSCRFPFLATDDGGQPRLRPVSPLSTDGFTVYIANLRHYGKTAEIAGNPHVELGYLDAHHNQVRITGVAEVVTDQVLLQQLWDVNSLLRQHVGSLDNPELIVYRVSPTRVRYMREWALEYHDVPLEPTDLASSYHCPFSHSNVSGPWRKSAAEVRVVEGEIARVESLHAMVG